MMEKTVVQGAAVGFILGFVTYFLCAKTKTIKLFKDSEYKFAMVVRTDISLTRRQAAVHCSRAALECYKKAKFLDPEGVRYWEKNGQLKIALKVNVKEQITDILNSAGRVGLIYAIIDKGDGCLSLDDVAVIGIGPGPAELVDTVTGHLKLL